MQLLARIMYVRLPDNKPKLVHAMHLATNSIRKCCARNVGTCQIIFKFMSVSLKLEKHGRQHRLRHGCQHVPYSNATWSASKVAA